VKAPHINEDHRYLLAIMRRSLTRTQSKYSAGGREKRRSRPAPSMPVLNCLKDGSAAIGCDEANGNQP
jgi:hypothetical protein